MMFKILISTLVIIVLTQVVGQEVVEHVQESTSFTKPPPKKKTFETMFGVEEMENITHHEDHEHSLNISCFDISVSNCCKQHKKACGGLFLIGFLAIFLLGVLWCNIKYQRAGFRRRRQENEDRAPTEEIELDSQ